MATRTSSRHAAQKAKEAMAAAPDTKRRVSVGTKRKGSNEKAPEPKREKKETEKKAEQAEGLQQVPERVEADEKPEAQPEETPAAAPDVKHEVTLQEKPEETQKEKQEKPRDEPVEGPTGKTEEKPDGTSINGTEAGMTKTEEREDIVPSNVIEKGLIYFFYRSRVNVPEAHSMQDVARSFFILRPTPLGSAVDREQGAADTGATCRLLMLPKKKYPRSGREREMGFVEKAGISMKKLQDTFIPGDSYETSTRGTREVPEAKPYAEGVYAITTTKRATHLVYHITLPEKAGEIQEDFGLSDRGSWLMQSKNPKLPGPPFARLPQEPEFPESIQQKFRNLRWIPTEPELLDYPNAQFLIIGSSTGNLGKAATAEPGDKRPEEEEPGEEIIKMEDENEDRIEALGGDHAIYKDLGYHAQEKYSKLETTWDVKQEE
ncbi:uncharacterized protein APUU_30504S [Aspergillus puulaauensis]|uniref:BTB domain transcription factor n=1 Tax=Aspergillus puulaauensis TaxID=1220207 RepID=A0A7R7XJ97_9EURO|nr:uncharacterized protein APUU_30504S [Aspergillus puulaauensis]BCS22279.1 hypothetical protein APUU_30504S [Aspergillus puulaauensis]